MVTLKLTRSGSRTRATRSYDEKIRALTLFENEGATRSEALIKAAGEFSSPVTKSMTDNPNGAFRLYVQSIRKALEAGKSEVEALVVQAGIGEEQPKKTGKAKRK